MKRKSGRGARAAGHVCQRLEHRLLLSGVSFLQFSEVATGSHPLSAAAADFNADGKIDVAVVNYQANTIAVRLNEGGGILGGTAVYPTGLGPFSVAASDFNGDGKVDLAVANYYGGSASVLLNRGDGTFAASNDYGTGVRPHGIAVADFDGDGSPDLVLANESSNSVSVLRNRGDGSFAAKVDYGVGSAPRSTTAGDFNGDNRPDIAVANSASNTLSVLLNQGDGTFAQAVDYPSGGIGPHAITSGDLNGDGRIDLAVSNYAGSTVGVLLNQGGNGFTAARAYPVSTGPFGLTGADLNGDSKLDLAVASDLGNTVGILLNNGGGMFGSPVEIASAASPSFVAVGDFNGDRKLDMAVANADSDTLRTFLNTTRTIVSGQPMTDQILSPGSDNVYAFTAVRGGTVHITMEEADGSDFDPELHLFTNTGHDFDYRFDPHSTYVDGAGDNLPYTGTYYVVAGDYGNNQVGTYTLSLTTTSGSSMPLPTAPGLTTSPGSRVASLTTELAWTGAAGASEYGLYVSALQPNGKYALVFDSRARGIRIDGSLSTYTLPTDVLADGGQYRWNMNAKINGVWGPYTPRLYFEVYTSLPPTPSGVLVSSLSPAGTHVTWSGDPLAAAYKVYRASSPFGPWVTPLRITAGSVIDDLDPILESGVDYYYRVSATNPLGDSPLSPFVGVRTASPVTPPTPTHFTATTQPDLRTVRLVWDDVLSSGSYALERQLPGGDFKPLATLAAGTNSFLDSDHPDNAPKTTIWYRLRAVAAGVASPATTGTATIQSAAVASALSPVGGMHVDMVLADFTVWKLKSAYARPSASDRHSIWDPVADLASLDWSKKTIFLTHGWNDKLDRQLSSSTGTRDYDEDFMNSFAVHYMAAYGTMPESERPNILALDWYSDLPGWGSDPNHDPDYVDVIDARKSYSNGVSVAGRLAKVLKSIPALDPARLMLVGHSNGAGLWANVALALHGKMGHDVRELVALDAPVYTGSHSDVARAAPFVGRVDNYYIRALEFDWKKAILTDAAALLFTTPLLAPVIAIGAATDPNAATGAYVQGRNVTNFVLKGAVVASNVFDDDAPRVVAHSTVALRFAATAARHVGDADLWGYPALDFDTVTVPQFDAGSLWVEEGEGQFTLAKRHDPPTAAELQAIYATERAPALQLGGIGTSVWSAGTTVGGGNANLWTPTGGQTTAPWINYYAPAPSAPPAGTSSAANAFDLFSTINVTVPNDASLLSFELNVTDPGTSDTLYVTIGETVIGELSLAARQSMSDGPVEFTIKGYGGQSVALSFLVPSAGYNPANFTISSIQFISFAADQTPPRVIRAQFDQAEQALALQFSEPVSVEDLSALTLIDATTGQAIAQDLMRLDYDVLRNVATISFPGLNGADLPVAYYSVTMMATTIRDSYDNVLDGDRDGVSGGNLTVNFFPLAGDATHDGVVNFADLLALARNYNKTGATWADGDFDANGTVNFNDLLTLARNYNKTLPASGAAPAPAVAMDVGALAAAMGMAVPTTTTPSKPTPPPVVAKKPPVSSKPAPKPTPVVHAVAPAAKAQPAFALWDDDKAKPVFSITRVLKPAPAIVMVVSRAKGR